MKFRIGMRVASKSRKKPRVGVIRGFLTLTIEPWGADDLAPGAWIKWEDDDKNQAVVALLEDLEEEPNDQEA